MSVVDRVVPQWRDLVIHESSPVARGASRRIAEQCPAYLPSHYFPGVSGGQRHEGFRCEDLEAMTFADRSIDVHITQDVMEHVLRPDKVFREIGRTLKHGGLHIFTVPLVNKDKASRKRVALSEAGDVIYLEPPEYHGNPVDPNGSLVTMDWGFDIVDYIERACGLKTEIVRLDDLSQGILAEYIEVLVTRKPPE